MLVVILLLQGTRFGVWRTSIVSRWTNCATGTISKMTFIYPGQHLVVKNDTGSKKSGQQDYSNKFCKPMPVVIPLLQGTRFGRLLIKFGITMDQFRSLEQYQKMITSILVKAYGSAVRQRAANQTASTSNYTVVSGDSVWGIADKFGISRDQFIQWK